MIALLICAKASDTLFDYVKGKDFCTILNPYIKIRWFILYLVFGIYVEGLCYELALIKSFDGSCKLFGGQNWHQLWWYPASRWAFGPLCSSIFWLKRKEKYFCI
jgi:hypothetical protein